MSLATRFLTVTALGLSLAFAAPLSVSAEASLATTLSAETLPKAKHTKSGLYLTAAEAAQVLSTRDDILLIDVRTPEETVLVGYAADTDANIPIATFDPSHTYNAKKGSYQMTPNKAFVQSAQSYLEGKDPAAVLVICRSGSRSARAIDMLIKAGVGLPLYSVVDGFEGDRGKSGIRNVNGWKNTGAAWTDKPRADLLVSSQ